MAAVMSDEEGCTQAASNTDRGAETDTLAAHLLQVPTCVERYRADAGRGELEEVQPVAAEGGACFVTPKLP